MDLEKIKNAKPIEELINFSILNIDKPSGWTSFDVVNHIRKMLGLKKCGHGGTLDPNVTGVLPIFLEKSCKIQEYFMHREKIYIGEMRIHKEISEEKLKEAMKKFLGKINQLPPRKSRVKRVIRQREIIKFGLTSFNKEEKTAEFIAHVEAGTYIRKLISDLGDGLGIGCQMTALRRIKAGIFSDKDAEFTTIENLEKAVSEYKRGKEEKLRELLIPAEVICKILDFIEVKQEAIEKLDNGSPIFKEMLENPNQAMKTIKNKGLFAVLCRDKLIEIAGFTEQFENPDIIAKPEVVLK